MYLIQINHIVDWLELFQTCIHTLGVGIVEEGWVEIFLQASTKAINVMDIQVIESGFIEEVIICSEYIDTRKIFVTIGNPAIETLIILEYLLAGFTDGIGRKVWG